MTEEAKEKMLELPTEVKQFLDSREDIPESPRKIEAPTIITREGNTIGKSEEFHRPDHADFKTTVELKKDQFSGTRHNELSNEVEVWLLGEIILRKDYDWVRYNPNEWAKMYGDIFGLSDVEMVEGRAN